MGIRVGALTLVFLIFGSFGVGAAGFMDSWREISPLPYKLSGHTSISHLNHVLVMGGNADYNYTHDAVIRATSGSLGELSAWDFDSARMPYAPIYHSSTTYGNYVYVLGGKEENVGSEMRTVEKVFLGTVGPDEHVTQWSRQPDLPSSSGLGSTWIQNGYIYYAGGAIFGVEPLFISSAIYRSTINLVTGNLGSWESIGSLPEPITNAAVAVYDKWVFLISGFGSSGESNRVWRGTIDRNGLVNTWTPMPALLKRVSRPQFGQFDNKVIVVGGTGPQGFSRSSYYFEIDGQGNFSEWKSGADLPVGTCCGAMAIANGYAYISGGVNEYGGYTGAVYVSEVGPHAGDPTPTLTPTPAPTSVPKVVIVPGMMASWNADAILNCKFEGYSGDWTLAPYARFVYDPLMKSLAQSGVNTIPFYYDWRARIASNGAALKMFVNSITQGDERVDLVGHSMGGLVSRAYMGVMGVNKVKNLVTAGSPHYGALSAYPAWAAGEIWNDDLVQRIATTLLMKSCSNKLHDDQRETLRAIIPSIQDLLPILRYLRNGFFGGLKEISSMQIKNGWLVDPIFDITGLGTKVVTMAGTGKPTIGEIVVIDPSPQDVLRGDWVDGKPVRWVKTAEGDGTVLEESALLPNATTKILKKDHVGVINSATAISYIKDVLGLGSEGAVLPEYNPRSALVTAVYPGEFKIVDSNGAAFESENGIVAIFDPRQIGRKLIIDKSEGERIVMIGRFMENGDYSWERKTVGGKSRQMISL